MTVRAEETSAAPSASPVSRILLAQLLIGTAVAALFWGTEGYVAGYSAVLGGLTCVIPNAFLALRLLVPRRDPGASALMRAAYIGELGKLALTVLMFGAVFALVRPLSPPAVIAAFVAGQLATFAGFLNSNSNKMNKVGTETRHGD